MPIINTRSDLEALRGTPDYGAALRALLGASVTWINTAEEDAPPVWEKQTVLSHIEKMGFATLDALLAECAAAGIVPTEPTAPIVEPVIVTADMVKTERDRRTYQDFEFETHSFNGNAKSYAAIEAKASIAADKAAMPADTVDWLATGIPTTWTDSYGTEVPMTMDAMISMRSTWILREQQLRQKARTLMALEPIPDDFATNENHWI